MVITFKKFINIKHFIIVFFLICLTTQWQINNTVVLLAQAPNYGEIQFNFKNNQQVIEQGKFLINTRHQIYTVQLATKYHGLDVELKLDGRHKYFVTYGVLIINNILEAYWISASDLVSNASRKDIESIIKGSTKAQFANFSGSPQLTVSSQMVLDKKFSLIFLLFCLAILFVFTGNLIVEVLSRIRNKFFLRIALAIALCITYFKLPFLLYIKILVFYWIVYVFLTYKNAHNLHCTTAFSKNHTHVYFVFLVIFIIFTYQKPVIVGLYNEIKSNKLFLDNNLLQKIGSFYERNFELKKLIGHYNSLLKISIFNYSPTPKVIIGKAGMMFEGTGERRIEGDKIASFDNVSDYLGRLPFNQEELRQWKITIEQRRCWLEKQGIEYLFVIAPTKALVYPEFLPNSIINARTKLNTYNRITQLENYLNNTNLEVLNLTNTLKSKKSTDYRLFYRTDFHWNYLGAFFAYQGIANKINAQHSNIYFNPLELNQFEIVRNDNWAHARFLGLMGIDPKKYNNDTYIKMVPKPENPLSQIKPYNEGVYDIKIMRKEITTSDKQNFSFEYIENPQGHDQKVVVIGDSFIQKVFPYFSINARDNYFSRAVFDFPASAIKKIKPKIVVQEILNMYLLRNPPKNKGEVAKALCDSKLR